jgi:tetratricopeptide (TPR) repeat protein
MGAPGGVKESESLELAKTDADRTDATRRLEDLRRERDQLEERRANVANAAAHAERQRSVRISRDAQNNPLADERAPSQPPASRGLQTEDSPPPLKGKLAEIDRAIRRKKLDDALAKAQEWHDKQPGDVLALIGLGEALEAKQNLAQASRIYGSIIDLFPGRADLRRFAGERLERVGETARGLAVDTYRRAVEERPDHMTGHRLLAYALLRNGQHAEAFAAILRGIDQRYPDDRFAGGMRVIKEDAGLIGAAYLAAQPDKKSEILAALRKHDSRLATSSSTRFIMYWETDSNDVDFHIEDNEGGHAFYSAPTLWSGGELYADITTGYGPECFTIPGRPKAGPYKLSINYYSQGPMGYGMGLLQILKHDGKGKLEFQDRPYVIMNDQAFVNLGTYK